MINDINKQLPVDAQIYFAVIPEWILDLPITASAVRVYCCLRRYADNKTGQCFPSRRTLATRGRMSVATLDRALKELVVHGAIKQSKRKNAAGDWTSNLYTVLSLPVGVVTILTLPATRITGTGTRKSAPITKANMNEKQELNDYDLLLTKAEPAPTQDGLLQLAQKFRELAEQEPHNKQTWLMISNLHTKQAKEFHNETD